MTQIPALPPSFQLQVFASEYHLSEGIQKRSIATLFKYGTVINIDCDFDVLSGEMEMCSSNQVQTSLAEQLHLLSITELPHSHAVSTVLYHSLHADFWRENPLFLH